MSLVSRDDGGDADPIAILGAVESRSRKNLVADIVGHPAGMPSEKELRHMNPSLAQSTVSEHLSVLEERGVVASASHPRSGHPPTAPKRFYYLTERAREVFDDNGLFEERAYREVYAQVEKPEDIAEAESYPRPAVDAATVDLD
jgi:DNA-binding transcriptional ArsR family regulator